MVSKLLCDSQSKRPRVSLDVDVVEVLNPRASVRIYLILVLMHICVYVVLMSSFLYCLMLVCL